VLKVPNALTFTGYSTGSFNGSSALSIAIPNNTNQLTNGMAGWSGMNQIRLNYEREIGGGTDRTSNMWNYRITLRTCTSQSGSNRYVDSSLSTSYTTADQGIYGIAAYGANLWSSPNNLVSTDHAYSWDNSLNVTFPANVAAPAFIGALTGNASTVTTINGKVSVSSPITLSGTGTAADPYKIGFANPGYTTNTGTVTSVAIGIASGSTGLSVDSGSPITSSGTIYLKWTNPGYVTHDYNHTITSNGTGISVTSSDSNSLNFVNGTGITLTPAAGSITIGHSNSITAGTISEGGSARTLGWSGTFKIPSITYDAQGHITAVGTTTLTMPSNPNTDTWRPIDYVASNGAARCQPDCMILLPPLY
jgi:hypothetical protein